MPGGPEPARGADAVVGPLQKGNPEQLLPDGPRALHLRADARLPARARQVLLHRRRDQNEAHVRQAHIAHSRAQSRLRDAQYRLHNGDLHGDDQHRPEHDGRQLQHPARSIFQGNDVPQHAAQRAHQGREQAIRALLHSPGDPQKEEEKSQEHKEGQRQKARREAQEAESGAKGRRRGRAKARCLGWRACTRRARTASSRPSG